MLLTHYTFEDGSYKKCDEYCITYVDGKKYIKLPATLLLAFNTIAYHHTEFAVNAAKNGTYLLYGHVPCHIDLYDRLVLIAAADNFEELMMFADLNGITASIVKN